jgi:hypothetical protein
MTIEITIKVNLAAEDILSQKTITSIETLPIPASATEGVNMQTGQATRIGELPIPKQDSRAFSMQEPAQPLPIPLTVGEQAQLSPTPQAVAQPDLAARGPPIPSLEEIGMSSDIAPKPVEEVVKKHSRK